MRLLIPRSEVVTDEGGWTWLQPSAASTRRRHTAGTFLLALFILIGGATWTLLVSPYRYAATAAVVAAGIWVLTGIVRGAASRVAWSGLGLYVQEGAHAQQVAWTGVRGVVAEPAGGRWRIRIDDGHRPRTTRGSFEAGAARQWLAAAADEAGRRRLSPDVAADGSGFTTS